MDITVTFMFHSFFQFLSKCCILTLDRTNNQRRTCVNKRKQSHDLSEVVGDMKYIRKCALMLEPACSHWKHPNEGSGLQGLRLSTLGQETVEVPSEVLKITQPAMVKRRSYGSIQQFVFVYLRPSLTHHRSFDSKKNKESYILIILIIIFQVLYIYIYIYILLWPGF